MWEARRRAIARRERPEHLGDQRGFTHAPRAADRDNPTGVQVSQQPGLLGCAILKVFRAPGSEQRRYARLTWNAMYVNMLLPDELRPTDHVGPGDRFCLDISTWKKAAHQRFSLHTEWQNAFLISPKGVARLAAHASLQRDAVRLARALQQAEPAE